MIEKVKLFFTPPVFEDQDKTLKARNSFFLAIVGFSTSVFILVFFLVFSPDYTFRLLVISFSVLFSLFPIVLLRKGYVQPTILFQAGIIWVGVVASSFSTGGIRSIGFIGGTFAALLVMGIALERLPTLIFISVSIFAAGFLAWGEGQGFVNPANVAEKPIVLVATYASFLFVLTGLLYATYRSVNHALSQARKEIMERERVEKEREEVIRELEARNDELLRFNYTVSHELKSPIVTIKGFLGSVENDLKRGDHERALKDFKRISNAANKMHATLSDLLELSRIGRMVNPSEKIELSELVQEALETVDSHIRSRNVTVHVSPNLPVVYYDRVKLREIFENLVSNATKYMGDQTNPSIAIGVRGQAGEPVIFVKDNGIGLEEQYFTRVFGLFEKLDTTSDGTGIGLALVKRVVEIYGGKIWVESDGLGKGSTFCFTIPETVESKS